MIENGSNEEQNTREWVESRFGKVHLHRMHFARVVIAGKPRAGIAATEEGALADLRRTLRRLGREESGKR